MTHYDDEWEWESPRRQQDRLDAERRHQETLKQIRESSSGGGFAILGIGLLILFHGWIILFVGLYLMEWLAMIAGGLALVVVPAWFALEFSTLKKNPSFKPSRIFKPIFEWLKIRRLGKRIV